MKKVHIWIGHFNSKKDFENYTNQKPYLEAWAIYDNTPPTGNPEEDKEPSQNLRCGFCKEIEIDHYDEVYTKIFYQKGISIDDFMAELPIDDKKLKSLIKSYKLNSYIICDTENLEDTAIPDNAEKMTYLGSFKEQEKIAKKSERKTTKGLAFSIWIGVTKKNKEDFYEYFTNINSDNSFVVDTKVKKFKKESLTVYFSNEITSPAYIIDKEINVPEIRGSITSRLADKGIYKANAMFCYVGKAKGNDRVKIFPKDYADEYPLPSGFSLEQDSYNDLIYLGTFIWD